MDMSKAKGNSLWERADGENPAVPNSQDFKHEKRRNESVKQYGCAAYIFETSITHIYEDKSFEKRMLRWGPEKKWVNYSLAIEMHLWLLTDHFTRWLQTWLHLKCLWSTVCQQENFCLKNVITFQHKKPGGKEQRVDVPFLSNKTWHAL